VSGDPATSNVANAASETPLFSVEKPTAEHNGGTIAIRDGFLYLALGDGGGIGDPDDLAQNLASSFGKILRFDLAQTAAAPQIWARRLRNPFRFSFDALTGDLYLGDVGFGDREEIDVEAAASPGGRNYGWDVEEASLCFDPTPALGEPACGDPGLVRPVHEYPHDPEQICNAVTGGVVYRGAAIPQLQGEYLFGDFCSEQIWSFVWDSAGGTVGPVVEQSIETDVSEIDAITAITEDGAGELLVVDLGGELFRLVPEPASAALGAASALALAMLRGRSPRPR
jgi:glucose/arabinose dehydrogenase